jgi:Ca2+-binding EF-hand superfamily protein
LAFNPLEQGIPLSLSHEEMDRELFAMFDSDGSGFIEFNDLEGIGKAMGWPQDQARELIFAIDPNHDGRVSFDEFLLVLRHVEERMQQNQPIQLIDTHGSNTQSHLQATVAQ